MAAGKTVRGGFGETEERRRPDTMKHEFQKLIEQFATGHDRRQQPRGARQPGPGHAPDHQNHQQEEECTRSELRGDVHRAGERRRGEGMKGRAGLVIEPSYAAGFRGTRQPGEQRGSQGGSRHHRAEFGWFTHVFQCSVWREAAGPGYTNDR